MSELARIAPTHPISILRDQIAPGAPDEDLAYFAAVCSRLDLSPFADQIVLIGRWDKKAGRDVYRHQITVAGRRTLASRTGRPYRVEGPMWCRPRVHEGAPLVWQEVWDDDDQPPYCARCLLYFTEFAEPAANGTAKWSEFAQYDSKKELLPLWRTMPSHMLGKVAESMVLRRAFPDVIDPAIADEFPYPVTAATDDMAELAEAAGGQVAGAVGVPAAAAPAPVLVGREWRPSSVDQRKAHAAIGALPEREQVMFLAQWDIGSFGEPWPPAAVADALGYSQEGENDGTS